MYINDSMIDSGALARRLLAPTNNIVPVNILTKQQASFEEGIGNWTGYIGCTIARSTAQALTGSASLAITSTGAGAVSVGTSNSLSQAIPVKPGTVLTAVASFRAASTTTNCQLYIGFLTATGTYISALGGTGLASITNSASGWTRAIATVVAPSNAAYMYVNPYFPSISAGSQIHYIDGVGLWEGAGGTWVNGGERLDPSTLGMYWDETVGRRLFVWDTVNSRYQMVYGDTGWRDVTSLIKTDWTADKIMVRRQDNIVHWDFRAIGKPTAFSGNIIDAPTGFARQVATGGSNGAVFWLREEIATSLPLMSCVYGSLVGTSNVLINAAHASNYRYSGSMIYSTETTWPTALPGTAVGSIPSA